MIKKVLRIGQKLWVHHSGRTFILEDAQKDSKGRPQGLRSASGIIESPMPGKVLKVNVKPGDHVEENQTLCVIEAMKMEYSLKAPFKGKIVSVVKKAGEQVTLGEKVLEMTK